MQQLITKFYQSKALKNTSWLIIEKLLTMILMLVINIFIARELGPENFGVLSYLIAIFSIISPISALGLNALVTKELVEGKRNQIEIMSTALFFRVIGGFLGLIIVLFAIESNLFSQITDYYWALILLSFVSVITALHIIDFWFQARVESKYIVMARLFTIILFFLIKAFLIYTSATLTEFILVIFIEYCAICVAFLTIYCIKSGRFSFTSINFKYGLSLLKKSYWLILSGIASVIYLKIDQVMLAEMVSVEETGIYAVASRLSEVWYFFATALVSSFFPALIKLKSEDAVLYENKLQQLNDWLFMLALTLSIIIYFLGELIVVFLYGKEYLLAGTILIIHIWASVFVFMRALLSKWLIVENLIKYSLLTHGLGALVNILMNLWLIPLWLGVGAAVATVVAYAFAAYIALFFSRMTLPMAYIMSKSMLLPLRALLNKVKFPN